MKLNVLPARAGAQWVWLGIRTFFRQPLALGTLFILFFGVLIVAAQIPIVGAVIALTLVPALTTGLMAATRETDGGKIPMPAILFTAFRQDTPRIRTMIALGMLYAVSILIMLCLFDLIVGPSPALSADIATPEQMTALLYNPRLWAAVLVTTTLYTLVSIPFWHAPALAHWHGVPALKSLFFSSVAILKNTRPFLLYGLAWLCLLMGAILMLTVFAALTGNAHTFSLVIIYGRIPLALLFQALFFTSLWFTFRDIFAADEPPPAASPA